MGTAYLIHATVQVSRAKQSCSKKRGPYNVSSFLIHMTIRRKLSFFNQCLPLLHAVIPEPCSICLWLIHSLGPHCYLHPAGKRAKIVEGALSRGCPAHELWATCSPGWLWIWLNTKSYIYLKHYEVFLFLLAFVYLMCGSRQLLFFQCGPETLKSWTFLWGVS